MISARAGEGPMRPALVILAVFMLAVWFLVIPTSQNQKSSESDIVHTDERTSSKVAASQTAITHRIGEGFSIGYWWYRCNGIRWQSAISSGVGSYEVPDAAFLVVDLSIRNDDRTASVLPPLKLVDAQGREYIESS